MPTRARSPPKTLSPRVLRQQARGGPSAAGQLELFWLGELARPRTRADCKNGPRPCPWFSCRFHLGLDVKPATGAIIVNFPEREVDQLPATCALDVADRGGATLEEVGDLMNVSDERIRQIIARVLKRVESALMGPRVEWMT